MRERKEVLQRKKNRRRKKRGITLVSLFSSSLRERRFCAGFLFPFSLALCLCRCVRETSYGAAERIKRGKRGSRERQSEKKNERKKEQKGGIKRKGKKEKGPLSLSLFPLSKHARWARPAAAPPRQTTATTLEAPSRRSREAMAGSLGRGEVRERERWRDGDKKRLSVCFRRP